MEGNHRGYDSRRYLALTLDPVHVGTGGYRLGRVDMGIVREPGTNLPKIPGTSLSGATRAYAAMQCNRFPNCAGQGQESEIQDEGDQGGIHCGEPNCPVCVTFGFARGNRGGFQGLAQFSDARLVLFPVHSLAGPVWVTSPGVLEEFGGGVGKPPDEKVRVAQGVRTTGSQLSLGWLMLDVDGETFSLGESLPVDEEIGARAVLVSDRMFGHVVNDNLEVRTSVSIDPATGAASEGALFTYEALPRASVLAFDVVINDPNYFKINGTSPLDGEMERVKDTVERGTHLFKDLGVGGMNTRGMGRMRVWDSQKENRE